MFVLQSGKFLKHVNLFRMWTQCMALRTIGALYIMAILARLGGDRRSRSRGTAGKMEHQ